MTSYLQGLPEQEEGGEEEKKRADKKRRGEEGVGIEEGMHSSTSLWASLFLPLRRAILSKRLLF